MGEPESIVEWIKSKADGGNYEEYINEDGDNSFKASVTAAEYFAMVEKSYAGKEGEFTQKLVNDLQASVEGLVIPPADSVKQEVEEEDSRPQVLVNDLQASVGGLVIP